MDKIAQQVAAMPIETRAAISQNGASLKAATQHVQGTAPIPSNDNRSSNAAMLQKATMQMNVKPAMSPTDAYAGRTGLQGPAQGVDVKGPDAPLQTPNAPTPPRGPSRGR